MTNITKPKGTADIFGANAALWRYIESEIHKTAALFGLEEMRTPMFENVELFVRSVGEATDIVQKEMYTFTDQGGRTYALKPESTAPAVRAYTENSLHTLPAPAKFYYIAPHFRAERPQKGRYRQHHQFGVEFFGTPSAAADAELISTFHLFITRLGMENFALHINSIGDADCRKRFNVALLSYLSEQIDGLCPLCRERMNKNPMRVLDCKNSTCQEIIKDAPVPLNHLSKECEEHFEQVQEYLTNLGIPYTVDKGIVRGLDYYNRTVFEFLSTDLGAQSAIGGGGRYDTLVNGGAVGFGMGIERLILILEAQDKLPHIPRDIAVFVGGMGDAGAAKAAQIVYKLRKSGISAISDLCDRSVKAQLKYADKLNAAHSLVIGDTELESGHAIIKNMQSGETKEIEIDKIVEFFGGRI
ncbi:MAG: histidine--tRNA ligase [Defluviitaleaceae bacterium]|nr:histidine--tRNA ligase [Defluviitaleaceae bacterium]